MTRPSRRMPPSGRSLLRPLQALRTFKRRVSTQRPETDLRIGVSPQPQVVGTEKLRALRCRRVMADTSPRGHVAGRHELTLAEWTRPSPGPEAAHRPLGVPSAQRHRAHGWRAQGGPGGRHALREARDPLPRPRADQHDPPAGPPPRTSPVTQSLGPPQFAL